MWEIIVLVLYSASVFFIILFSIGQLSLLFLFIRHKGKRHQPLTLFEFPLVTIQLPVYNERYVIERLLRSVAMLNYPKEKMEIQILDDSTDETSDICQREADKLTRQGFNVRYMHRSSRKGFKAGALQDGLLESCGEFLVIFDADFIPDPDFLTKTLPYFTTQNIGLVQTRWGHINASQSWLTRVQELGLNGHFIIDQQGRDKSGLFINFNGTAGIWRKSCIVDAGGWQFDTLTEDLDLSYRAQMRGWKLNYCPDIITPAELPFLLNSLRNQQFRWIKGGIETSIKILGKLWTCNVSVPIKLFGSFHLLSNYVYLFILLSSILSVPAMFIKNTSPQFDLYFKLNSLFFSVFIINFLYCFVTVWVEKKGIGESIREMASVFPMAILISLGMSYHNSTAIYQGVVGKKTSFVRTPKFKAGTPEQISGSNYNLEKNIFRDLPEILLFIYFSFAVAAGVYFRDIGFLTYHLILVSSFGVILYFAFLERLQLTGRSKKTAIDLNPPLLSYIRPKTDSAKLIKRL
ncbi:MAG TPA: glycosyltransferase [Daejeonella sp.]|nr:glycosyltransferase [Daejeonella sp.]